MYIFEKMKININHTIKLVKMKIYSVDWSQWTNVAKIIKRKILQQDRTDMIKIM